uniref:helix-turn-helix domain-containing protein n=1 Tax=uncultured Winogradskyella sp. TaxID=395353 RepID=UPI002610B303
KTNFELILAHKFVEITNRNIFLTGKAGTGKTTFLHKLKENSSKRIIVVAPTGVAAINAKGVTIHSFFQLPFGPIIPELNASSDFNRKFSRTKIDIIKSLDLLVIDEISMVRADLLDGIDKTLRKYRDRDKVFGGVQVLMIGDLQQLSPVVNDNDWELLKNYYKNVFFFSSNSYKKSNPIVVELKHIYRQDNPVFINILNDIRNNILSAESAEYLNKRYLPNFNPKEDEGYISLTTHNSKAISINNRALENIKGEVRVYNAKVDGKYPEHSFPNKEELKLKVGAQVMFIKNDSSPEKRYYNGKIGKVILLDKDEVVVKCPEDEYNIITTFETWENIKYNIDENTNSIKEEKIGSYSQIPLRLAWSITIHKSQGLTFEKAIIDAEDAFAHGQTYVALSRCKSLEGLVLKSKILPSQIITDTNVLSFSEQAEANPLNEKVLFESQRLYQLELISEIFDFYEFLFPINRILDVYYKNRTSIEGDIEKQFISVKETITNLLKISNSFNVQLESLTQKNELPEQITQIQERFTKGLLYFLEATKSNIQNPFKSLVFSTDNKAIEKDITKQLDALEELIVKKLLYFEGLKDGFNTTSFLKLRSEAVFLSRKQPKKQRKAIIEGTKNVKLFELLKALRHHIAMREDVAHFQVFTQKSLYAMCELLPTTSAELKAVHGMGKTRVEKYGAEILEIISEYINDNDIEITNTLPITQQKPKRQKGDSQKESLELFKQGKTIEEIANIRELNENTIFGHLASFIPSGKIKMTELISEDHYSELKLAIPKQNFENLSDLKHQLDDKFSYAEIRLVLDELSSN